MKNALAATFLAAVASLSAGCELKAVQPDTAESQGRVYTTGSNVGRRPADGAPGSAVTTVGRDAAEQQINIHGNLPPPAGGGH